MTTRRTRKEKESARHSFSFVKGQFPSSLEAKNKNPIANKKAKDTEKQITRVNLKKDILKSLFIALLILALEVVIYLALSKWSFV